MADRKSPVVRSPRRRGKDTHDSLCRVEPYGLTTVTEVTRALGNNHVATADNVERVLRADPSVRFTSDGWLWVEKPNYRSAFSNSLRNAARAILSVNAPQTIGGIREGFKRWQKFRQRNIIPSCVAVGEFLMLQPEFAVDGETVHAVEPLDFWTTYADWLEHFAPNIWGLRGARLGTAADTAP